MVTLKQLHENFIDEQIRENYFLNTLFEAINVKQITKIADSIDKLEDVADKFKNGALDAAMLEARKDAKQVATAGTGKQEEILTNLIGFYSKITNFLKTDLQALQRVNLKDFFAAGTADDAKLVDDPEAEDIRKVLRKALTTDSFFGQILGKFGLTSQLASAVPYLKIENFIQTFMTTPKSELETNINEVIGAAGSLPQNPTSTDTAPAGGGAGGGAPAGGGAGGGAPAGKPTDEAVKAFDALIGKIAASIAKLETKPDKTDEIARLIKADKDIMENIANQVFVKGKDYVEVVRIVRDYAKTLI